MSAINLLDYLREATLAATPAEHAPTIDAWIVAAKAALRTNQPIAIEYLTAGLGLKLQDSTTVHFGDESPQLGGDGALEQSLSFPVMGQNMPRQPPGIVPSTSIPVTGRKHT